MTNATSSAPAAHNDGRINMSDLLQSAYELKQAEEQRAKQSRQALADVVIRICPEKLDRDRRFLERASANELAEVLISEIADRLDELDWYRARSLGNSQSTAAPAQTAGGRQDQAYLSTLEKEIATLRQEAEDIKGVLRNYETQIQQLLVEKTQLQAEKTQLHYELLKAGLFSGKTGS